MITAYASFNPSPITSTPRDRTESTASLPLSGLQLYGGAVDTTDPSASFSFAWSVLNLRDGQTATLATPTAQNTLLNGVNDVWGDVRVFLIATNTATGETGCCIEGYICTYMRASLVNVCSANYFLLLLFAFLGGSAWSLVIQPFRRNS